MKKNKVFVGALTFITIFLSLFLGSAGQVSAADNLPDSPRTFYYDEENILSQETKDLITKKDEGYKSSSEKPQIVLAVVKNADDINDYANKLFKKWQIGQAGSDNGVLIVYAMNDGRRNVRIEVGYGLEGALTDALSGNILRANASKLKSDDPAKINEGLQNTFNAITTVVDKEYGFKPDQYALSNEELNSLKKGDSDDEPSWLSGLITILVVALLIFSSLRTRFRNAGPRDSGERFSTIWNILYILSLLGGSGDDDDDDHDHWGGFGGGGFGGGGGFSGGGGSSGGGGASI